MKKSSFSLFLLLILSPLFAQTNTVIDYANPTLYKGDAVIFTKEYEYPSNVNRIKKYGLFTPLEHEIIKAEHILYERYNEDFAEYGWHLMNVKKAFSCYHRQYIGYFNERGEKIIMMLLIRMKPEEEMEENFPNWKRELLSFAGEYYENNTRGWYQVNITIGKLVK